MVIPQGMAKGSCDLSYLLAEAEHVLTATARGCYWAPAAKLQPLDYKPQEMEHKIQCACARSDACQQLTPLEGSGPGTATACMASVGPATIKPGRQRVAWVGFGPLQQSSGGKQSLRGNISESALQ
jgi:transposase